MVSDKPLEKMLPLLPVEAQYYWVCPAIFRALDSDLLMKSAGKYGLEGENFPSVQAGIRSAMKAAGPQDLVFIGGSTFVVAEIPETL